MPSKSAGCCWNLEYNVSAIKPPDRLVRRLGRRESRCFGRRIGYSDVPPSTSPRLSTGLIVNEFCCSLRGSGPGAWRTVHAVGCAVRRTPADSRVHPWTTASSLVREDHRAPWWSRSSGTRSVPATRRPARPARPTPLEHMMFKGSLQTRPRRGLAHPARPRRRGKRLHQRRLHRLLPGAGRVTAWPWPELEADRLASLLPAGRRVRPRNRGDQGRTPPCAPTTSRPRWPTSASRPWPTRPAATATRPSAGWRSRAHDRG